MEKKTNGNSSDNGLELDKINLSGLAGTATAPKPAPKAPPAPEADKEAPREKKRFRLTLAIALAILAVLISLILLFRQQNYSFNFFTAKTQSTVESYLRVGPISATLANNDIINFSLDIDCGSKALKEQLAGRDSQLRDRILAVIVAPGTDELLENHKYDEVKAKIRQSLGAVTTEPVGDIYISEMLRY